MGPSKKKYLLAASAATAMISLVGLAGPSLAAPGDPSASPSTSAPASETETAADVAKQVQEKQEELTQVNEEYLDAQLELTKQNEAKTAADAALAQSQQDLATAKANVAAMGAEQYMSSGIPASVYILVGDSPSDFIDKANAQQYVDDYNAQTIAALSNAEEISAAAKIQADEAQAAAAAASQTIAEKKAYIEAELPALEAKLATLTEQERAALEASQGGTTEAAQEAAADPTAAAATEAAAAPAAAASGSAQKVVDWAMSQRGKAYVWGGAGPNGYDCSGLTMMAYKQVGISLPHSSSAQRGYGTKVSLSALQPGDLVFAPGHVAIYIGNGTVVHAPTFGSPVRTMPMSYMSWSMATRLV